MITYAFTTFNFEHPTSSVISSILLLSVMKYKMFVLYLEIESYHAKYLPSVVSSQHILCCLGCLHGVGPESDPPSMSMLLL